MRQILNPYYKKKKKTKTSEMAHLFLYMGYMSKTILDI